MWKGTPVNRRKRRRYSLPDRGWSQWFPGFLGGGRRAADCPKLLRDEKLREQMGRKARQTVAGRFLLTRNLEDYLDLFGFFETIFRLRR